MRISRRLFLTRFMTILSGVIFIDVLFERFSIKFKEYHLNSNPEITHLKAIQISDLHLKKLRFHHDAMCKQIENSHPDLLLLTGDLIDDAKNLPELESFLKLLPLATPKFAVLGNWEYWGGVAISELQCLYAKYGCKLLINSQESVVLKGRKITITGIDDFVAGKADIKKATENFSKSDYHLVLNHCPQYSEQICLEVDEKIPVDLILSGHTHGGQINFFGFVPFLPQGSGRFVGGWYTVGKHNLYVSKGIGTSILPIRFGARAEIAIFNF